MSRKLPSETFRCIVAHTPLISIDLIVRHEGRILLGRRRNEPAKGYWFTTGGRIFKNETIAEAQRRIAKEELHLEDLPSEPKFLGIFEHFYETSPFEGVATHYVNLAYFLEADRPLSPPADQHDAYRWFTPGELLADPEVHEYVKLYFKKDEHGR